MPAEITIVLGAQWGDEGKGKLVDILCQTADVCARTQGGNNAGHTIKYGNTKFAVHLLPSGKHFSLSGSPWISFRNCAGGRSSVGFRHVWPLMKSSIPFLSDS